MKPVVSILFAFALLCSFCAFARESADWAQILAANEPAAILEQVGACRIESDDSTLTFALLDGEVIWSNDDADCIGGAVYSFDQDFADPIVWFLTPGSQPLDFISSPYSGYELDEFTPVGDITLKKGLYTANLEYVDEEYGAVITGRAQFEADTLLLKSMDLKLKWGRVTEKYNVRAFYGEDAPPVLNSYNAAVRSDDTIAVTLHTGEGQTREYTLPRNAEIAVQVPVDEPFWSLCRDEACTEGVNHLLWVKGGSADLYLSEEYVPLAAPSIERVLSVSSFDAVMEANYNTCNQSFWFCDADGEYTGRREIAWILTEEHGMELYLETMNADFEADFSAVARDGAWYSWSEESGYSVSFYSDFSYAEAQLSGLSVVVDDRLSGLSVEPNERESFSILRTEDLPDGGVRVWEYDVFPENDVIHVVFITDYDADGNLTQTAECGIYGNSGIPSERDVFTEFTKPDGVRTVRLTVVTAEGEREYTVRKDASVSHEGGPVYRDKERTQPVGDLSWVSGKSAVIYA